MTQVYLIKKIHSLLGRFNIGEMRKNASPCFPAVTWKNIFDQLEKEKLKFSLKNMKLIMTKSLRTEKIESLQTIYIRLSVVDVALHSRRKTWISYKMEEAINSNFDLQNLHRDVRQGCRLNNVECEVQSLKLGELIWISIIEKKILKTGGVKWKQPIFCAYFLHSCYIFFSCAVDSSILNAVLHAMHYKSARQLSLTGRDIKSLYNLLKKKESGPSECVLTTYKIQNPKHERAGVDYTQHDSRKSFADSCFGDGSIKLETVSFMSRNGSCEGLSGIPTSEGLKMSCSLQLVSSNIFLYFQEMLQNNVIDAENCPSEIKNLMYSGKNIIKV